MGRDLMIDDDDGASYHGVAAI